MASTNLTAINDGELLSSFVERRDHEAFTEIVHRHGAMVLGVCRSVLGNASDAEDATQAVFLALFYKASSLKSRISLAGWLHQVAWNVAMHEKRSFAIRTRYEQEAANMKSESMLTQDGNVPLDRVHSALGKLPEKYRLPIILHHLEGRSQEEVASLLASNTSAISVRLNRGRQMLREKLAGAAPAVSVGGLTSLMADQASAGISSLLVDSITAMATRGLAGEAGIADVMSAKVIALSKTALKGMFLAKVKYAAAIVIAATVILGSGLTILVAREGGSSLNPVSVAIPAMAGQELSVDCSRKYQTIVGLGAHPMHWTGAGDLHGNKEIQKMFVEDLGATIVRLAIEPDVLPNEVPDARDISYKNFKVGGDTKKAIDFVAAVYAANPKEMTVVGSVWTPPAWMKTNNSRKNGGSLKPDRVEHYAKYLAEWVLYMKEVEKTPIHYLSIQNELSFKEPYDSCVYTADTYARTALAVCDAFKSANLGTRLFGPEEMTWNVNNILKCVNPILDDPRGKERFTVVASHGYSDGIKPASSAREDAKLWQALEPMGVQWWMTETSGTAPEFFGAGQDKNGKPNPGAFSLASSIHNAFVYGNASAWIYWCLSGHSKSSSDNAAKEALMNAEKPYDKYYASRQFYKFIRPGAVRVEAGPDGEKNLQISAFLHEKNKTLSIVLLNYSARDAAVLLNLKAAPSISSFETYRTSEGEYCRKLQDSVSADGRIQLTLPAQSIMTLYGRAISEENN